MPEGDAVLGANAFEVRFRERQALLVQQSVVNLVSARGPDRDHEVDYLGHL